MACNALAAGHTDRSSPAAILIQLTPWGGMLKASALMLAPRAGAAKARVLEWAGFLNVGLVVCLAARGVRHLTRQFFRGGQMLQ